MLFVPAVALASGTGRTPLSGGGGIAGTVPSSSAASTPSTPSSVQPATQSVQASGNGITITTRSAAMLRNQLRFSGTVSGAPGQVIEVQRRGRETNWTWANTTHGRAQSDGSWSAVWPANHIGRFAIRAVLVRGRIASARAAAASPTLTVTVFRPAIATQYGPGFYGSRTACGEVLRPTTIGVANRTLKCGTPVAILWHGRTMVVPVIDRGPYANNADWDLTEAAGRALGIDGTATIGAVSLPSH
jgi:hypothetical protein